MPKVPLPSHGNRFPKRQSFSLDVNELPLSSPSPTTKQTPAKVLIFNGKCSRVFKSTLEDCVEDCILEFPAEKNSIYVPKSGPAIPVPIGSNRNSISSLREHSARQSTRSNRPRNSNSLPSVSGVRTSLTNNFPLPTTVECHSCMMYLTL